MKKVLSIILIAVLCAAMAGCAHGCGRQSDESASPDEEGEMTGTPEELPDEGEEKISQMYITVNGNKLTVTLAENKAVEALVKLLREGDIVYYADDYGDFEKVGSLGHTLPASNSQIKTEPGDVMLYNSNQIVIFYGNNSWSYTRIGKIEGYTTAQLRTLLGAGGGRVQVTVSLT